MARYIEESARYQPMQLPAAVDDYVSSASSVRAIDGTFIKATNSSARSSAKAKLDQLSSKPSTSPSPATSTNSNRPIKTKTRPAPALLPPKAQPPNSSANSPKTYSSKPF
jgi:hypothetical protein